MSIEVKNVTKRFGSFTALDNVTLEVGGGDLPAAGGHAIDREQAFAGGGQEA